MIDDFSRECVATVVDKSNCGVRVARELDRIAAMRGLPCMVGSDNGTEMMSNALLKWQEDRQVGHSIAPGKPMQNGLVGSFDGRLPDECLNEHRFPTLRHACCMGAAWRDEPAALEPRRAHPTGASPTVGRGPKSDQSQPTSADPTGSRSAPMRLKLVAKSAGGRPRDKEAIGGGSSGGPVGALNGPAPR